MSQLPRELLYNVSRCGVLYLKCGILFLVVKGLLGGGNAHERIVEIPLAPIDSSDRNSRKSYQVTASPSSSLSHIAKSKRAGCVLSGHLPSLIWRLRARIAASSGSGDFPKDELQSCCRSAASSVSSCRARCSDMGGAQHRYVNIWQPFIQGHRNST